MSQKSVLVAGASGGIGRAVVNAIESAGDHAFGVDRETLDVTQPGGAEDAVFAAREKFGRLDGIVHAVGMSGRGLGDGPVSTCTDEAWAEVHRVNYESVFRLLRAAIPVLAGQGGGSVVVVGSALASTLDEDFLTAAYMSAKGALLPLMRHSAFVGAPHNVRVNVVAPGLVDTPMAERALARTTILERMPHLHRLGSRPSTPDEVADVVHWLLSNDSARITGAVLPADGGWTLR